MALIRLSLRLKNKEQLGYMWTITGSLNQTVTCTWFNGGRRIIFADMMDLSHSAVFYGSLLLSTSGFDVPNATSTESTLALLRQRMRRVPSVVSVMAYIDQIYPNERSWKYVRMIIDAEKCYEGDP